jgi:uncharacterized protein (DUF2141 family)
MRLTWTILAFALGAGLAAPAMATDVKIRVHGVTSANGVVRVEVCTPETFMKGCPYRAKAPAHPGIVEVTVPNVPPGTYAMLAHHDINNDGKVNRSLLGIPEEGVGFSRDPLLSMRAPTFDETSVPVAGPLAVVDITLKFEP